MTEVIAVRRFWWESEPDRELLVSIGKPAQTPDHMDYYCPIQTSGFGDDESVRAIFGIDAFQALELAMRFIEYTMADIDDKSGGQLRWEFGDDKRIPREWAQKTVDS